MVMQGTNGMTRFVLLAMMLASGLTVVGKTAQAQVSNPAPTPQLHLSDIDPPIPQPGFQLQAPLHRASGAELRNQALDNLRKKFEVADTSGTGAITAAQASQHNLNFVAKHFAQIDTGKRGVVTFDDVRRYLQR